MAKLHFSLVAPERELFSADVDQVDAPARKAISASCRTTPLFMTTLREGRVTVRDGSTVRLFDIQGGFADVGPDGFTILAEHAVEAA